MKRFAISLLALGVIVTVALTGCGQDYTLPEEETAIEETAIEETAIEEPMAPPSSVVANPPLVAGATFVVAPAYLELGGLYPNAEVSTWTQNGYLDLAGSAVPYSKGDPVCIAIYNGQDHTVSYEIEVVNAPLEINQCNTLNKEYHMAPGGFIAVVRVADTSPTLSPYEIKTIPFSFVLPRGLDYPEMWEFRITIAERGVEVSRAYGVRIFITMQ